MSQTRGIKRTFDQSELNTGLKLPPYYHMNTVKPRQQPLPFSQENPQAFTNMYLSHSVDTRLGINHGQAARTTNYSSPVVEEIIDESLYGTFGFPPTPLLDFDPFNMQPDLADSETSSNMSTPSSANYNPIGLQNQQGRTTSTNTTPPLATAQNNVANIPDFNPDMLLKQAAQGLQMSGNPAVESAQLAWIKSMILNHPREAALMFG